MITPVRSTGIGDKMPKRKLYVGYIFVMLFTIAFVSNTTLTTNAEILTPHINYNANYIFLILSVIICGLLVLFRSTSIRIDEIQLLLLLRPIVIFVPLLYMGRSSYAYGNILPYIISMIMYFIIRQSKLRINSIKKILVLFTVSVCLEALYAFFTSSFAFTSTIYKYSMVTTVGASNYLACVLVPCILFSYGCIDKIWLKRLVLLLGIVAIVLTKSRTGIVIFGLFFLGSILVNNKSTLQKHKVILSVFAAGIFIFMAVLNLSKIIDVTQSIFRGFSGQFMGINILDTISSGRVGLLIEYLDKWLDHPLFGHGLVYTLGKVRCHNFLVEILYESGLIGLLVNITLYGIIIKRSWKYRKNTVIKTCYITIASILMQGLIEESIFTVTINLICWIVIACMLNEIFAIQSYQEINVQKDDQIVL